ncbi:Non-specific serine/threonine protein kinase [Bertholletia excelsa]
MITTKVQVRALAFFAIGVMLSAIGQSLPSCETASFESSSGYHCYENESRDQCGSFAILRTNSYFSSLSNLSLYLGIKRFDLAQANGFSAETEFLPRHQPLLIPIDCKCQGAFFQALITKTTIKGESFLGIAESLEGLTSCKSIREKNPNVSPWDLGDKLKLLIPLRCACPSLSDQITRQTKLLISYPVSQGDTVLNLSLKFNVTPESIISANRISGASFNPENLITASIILIPLRDKPLLGSLAKPQEPNLGIPVPNNPAINPRKRKSKMWKIGIYVAVSAMIFGSGIALAATFMVVRRKKKKRKVACKMADLELQQPGISGSSLQNTVDTAPHGMMIEIYTVDELRQATEDFSSSNLIEGSVFYGRLNGKNLAIKRTRPDIISKIDFGLFLGTTHLHPNIMRLMGTCSADGSDSFVVLEYARNGSLKDWLHGGLAVKSQFITSCYCFLSWNQRLRICLDVATALQYMHEIMLPRYAHGNIKSRNIFLDEEFNAKVANFGMVRCFEDRTDKDEPFWNRGYLAPEFVEKGVLSPSVDVFAYGVVLLEVLSGLTPITTVEGKTEDHAWLSQKIKTILRSDSVKELRGWMDSALGENYSFDGAMTLANLARACVDDDVSLRPNAGEIVEKISRLVETEQGDEFSICESSYKALVREGKQNSHLTCFTRNLMNDFMEFVHHLVSVHC